TVLLLTDPDHAVPVMVARNGVRLIVYGRGDHLELSDVPLNTEVEEGDLLVTSGLGGRFPAGFPVGSVTSLRADDSRAFLLGQVEPAARLDRGRDVLLLRSAPQRLIAPRPAGRSSEVAIGLDVVSDSTRLLDPDAQAAAAPVPVVSGLASPPVTPRAPARQAPAAVAPATEPAPP
ncbi:MAG TPA: rod shape-determining protein MreC, partial [Pseudoxanthomonas sp.]|nr:rod shape-determining protein MreC [Pseudoxanthomonas sp.]